MDSRRAVCGQLSFGRDTNARHYDIILLLHSYETTLGIESNLITFMATKYWITIMNMDNRWLALLPFISNKEAVWATSQSSVVDSILWWISELLTNTLHDIFSTIGNALNFFCQKTKTAKKKKKIGKAQSSIVWEEKQNKTKQNKSRTHQWCKLPLVRNGHPFYSLNKKKIWQEFLLTQHIFQFNIHSYVIYILLQCISLYRSMFLFNNG